MSMWYSLVSMDQKSRHSIAGSSGEGLTRLESRLSLGYILIHGERRVLFQVHSSCWKNWTSCKCATESLFSCWLSVGFTMLKFPASTRLSRSTFLSPSLSLQLATKESPIMQDCTTTLTALGRAATCTPRSCPQLRRRHYTVCTEESLGGHRKILLTTIIQNKG